MPCRTIYLSEITAFDDTREKRSIMEDAVWTMIYIQNKGIYLWIGPGANMQKMRMFDEFMWGARFFLSLISSVIAAAKSQTLILSRNHFCFVICKMGIIIHHGVPTSSHLRLCSWPVRTWAFFVFPIVLGVGTYRQKGEPGLVRVGLPKPRGLTPKAAPSSPSPFNPLLLGFPGTF